MDNNRHAFVIRDGGGLFVVYREAYNPQEIRNLRVVKSFSGRPKKIIQAAENYVEEHRSSMPKKPPVQASAFYRAPEI